MGHQGLEVTEEKEDLRALQVTQDNLALPDLLVPLVHAVVGVLQSLVEAKKLAGFPHIMEMNLWT